MRKCFFSLIVLMIVLWLQVWTCAWSLTTAVNTSVRAPPAHTSASVCLDTRSMLTGRHAQVVKGISLLSFSGVNHC